MIKQRPVRSGFSLVELLIVMAIFGVLSTLVFVAVDRARERTKETQVRNDLSQMRSAIILLEADTDQHPNHLSARTCTGNTEINLDVAAAGLVSTDGAFPGWSGPYHPNIPLDPWGSTYEFDPDYHCDNGTPADGCIDSGRYRALVSHGPNQSATNAYDADNIILTLCRCPSDVCT